MTDHTAQTNEIIGLIKQAPIDAACAFLRAASRHLAPDSKVAADVREALEKAPSP